METTVYSHGNIFHCTFSDIMYLFTCCCFLFISILTILYFMAKAVGCLHFAGLYLLCHCWGKHSVTSFHIIALTDPSCMLILQILCQTFLTRNGEAGHICEQVLLLLQSSRMQMLQASNLFVLFTLCCLIHTDFASLLCTPHSSFDCLDMDWKW